MQTWRKAWQVLGQNVTGNWKLLRRAELKGGSCNHTFADRKGRISGTSVQRRIAMSHSFNSINLVSAHYGEKENNPQHQLGLSIRCSFFTYLLRHFDKVAVRVVDIDGAHQADGAFSRNRTDNRYILAAHVGEDLV